MNDSEDGDGKDNETARLFVFNIQPFDNIGDDGV